MVDQFFGKVVGWIDQAFSFVNKYSDLFVYGFIAMMVAKLAKFKIKIGK